MEIKKALLTPNRFSRPETPLKSVKKIAVHYVGNAGSTAIANRNYFESLQFGKMSNGEFIFGSSHYIIGLNGEIIQCVPETEWAYCTNKANAYSVSIECCHPRADGVFTRETRKSLVWLCADLCERYELDPIEDIIRHFDVTGKRCPRAWADDPADFTKFKEEVENAMAAEKVYNSLQEMPEWARPAIMNLLNLGYLAGDEKGNLGLTETALKVFAVNNRAGLYK